MKDNKTQNSMLRKEKAAKKQPKITSVEYTVENEDITILSGPYAGKKVKELFITGPAERDYVVKHIWFTGGEKVTKIINGLMCK